MTKKPKRRRKSKADPRRAQMRREIETATLKAFKEFEKLREERAPPVERRAPMKISDTVVAQSRRVRAVAFRDWFEAARPMPGVAPANASLAMDEAITDSIAWAAGAMYSGAWADGATFLGYPALSAMAQRPEYRRISEVIATEMTREWIEITSSGDGDKSNLVKAVGQMLDDLKVKDHFSKLMEMDGWFGRAHLYFDVAGQDTRDELIMSIGDGRDNMSKLKVSPKNKLERLKVIEPVWCYPTNYNSNDPLARTWYHPEQWFVMGKQIHASRLFPFVVREVPDLFKPAYAFGGLSMSQMAKPYVDYWLKTRSSVSSIISAFSVFVLGTNMQATLESNASDFWKRVDMFNSIRDNNNAMVIDKDNESVTNVAVPLNTLDVLQAQTQEHMASVSGIPLVKLLGIQPAGLNATAEGELRVFYDNIAALQEKKFRTPLQRVIDFCQLSEFGAVDPSISFTFKPLWTLDAKSKAELEKVEADTDGEYVEMGVVSTEEVRKRLASDPDSRYHGLDPNDMPEPPVDEADLEPGETPDDGGDNPEGSGNGGKPLTKPNGGAKPPRMTPNKPANPDRAPKVARAEVGKDAPIPFDGAADSAVWVTGGLARDDWNESAHPREQDSHGGKKAGEFAPKGGGGGGGGQKFKAPQLGLPHGPANGGNINGWFGQHFDLPKPKPKEPLNPTKLKKVGAQKGSNPGGVYEDEDGQKFYIKQGKSPDHVRNERIAAALYKLAGAPTLKYRDVEGGKHIATEMEKLDKSHAHMLSPEERREAQIDFATHAWLGNWDSVGLGGDNLGTIKGVPTSLDLGGALEYRAQGAPKGKAFGTSVGEVETLRDKSMNPDAAGVYGSMTPAQMRESARIVMRIPDSRITDTVERFGGSPHLAEKLIARKQDLAKRAAMFGAEKNPEKPTSAVVFPTGSPLPVKEINGVAFKPWTPPDDWSQVDGQNPSIEEPAFDPKNKKPASGAIIREKDGRVWLVQPRGGYGGYEGAFPKGGVDRGLSLQANAIKEVWEETGLKVKLTGFVGDRDSEMSHTRFYLAERVDGDPSQHGDETEGVVLAPPEKAAGFLTRNRDRAVLEGASDEDLLDLAADEWKESDHPRLPAGESGGGEFAPKGSGGGAGGGGAAAAKPENEQDKADLASAEAKIKQYPAGWNFYKALTPAEKNALTQKYGYAMAAHEQHYGVWEKLAEIASKAKTAQQFEEMVYSEQEKGGTGAMSNAVIAKHGSWAEAFAALNGGSWALASAEAKVAKLVYEDGYDLEKFAQELLPEERTALKSEYGDVASAVSDIFKKVQKPNPLTQPQMTHAINDKEVQPLDVIAKQLGYGGWTASLTPKQTNEIVAVQNLQAWKYAEEIGKTKASNPDDLKIWARQSKTLEQFKAGLSTEDSINLKDKYGDIEKAWVALSETTPKPSSNPNKPGPFSQVESGALDKMSNIFGTLPAAWLAAKKKVPELENMPPEDVADLMNQTAAQYTYSASSNSHIAFLNDLASNANNKKTASPAASGGEQTFTKKGPGGLYKPGKTPEDAHKNTIKFILHDMNDSVYGASYRQLISAVINETKKFGTTDQVDALKKKLGMVYFNAANKLGIQAAAAPIGEAAALYNKADAAMKKAKELGYFGAGEQPPKGFTSSIEKALENAKPTKPSQKAHFEEKAKNGDTIKVVDHPSLPDTYLVQQIGPKGEVLESEGTGSLGNAKIQAKAMLADVNALKQPKTAKAAAAEPVALPDVKPTSKATPDELKKAAKTTPWYGSAVSEEGQKLIEMFDAKYANKPLADPAALEQKVADFKATKAAIEKADAAYQVKSQAEKQAIAAKQAAAQKAKEAAEAKAAAEKNKEVMDKLGINAQEAEGFNALAGMLGGSSKDVISKFKHYEKEAEGYGYPITGFQAALIKNYTNGGYSSINAALRKGSWTTAQHVYVKMMNKALQAMPTYKGVVKRGTTLSLQDQQKYVPGHVVPEAGFTSTSITHPWDGNTKFTITAIGKRGAHVKKLSNHPGEDEVVFSAHTLFKVTKVEGKPGGQMHVWMEEMEGHD